jgi:hypothetical protein
MTDAFLFINVQFLFIDDVMNKLKEISEIIDVHKVQGTYDIIARVPSFARRILIVDDDPDITFTFKKG